MTNKQLKKIVKHLNKEQLIDLLLIYANYFEPPKKVKTKKKARNNGE